jgi:hypothetical protein
MTATDPAVGMIRTAADPGPPPRAPHRVRGAFDAALRYGAALALALYIAVPL